MSINYKGTEFASGEEVNFIYKNAVGSAFLHKTPNRIYVCHDNESLNGHKSPNLYGKPYSFAISINASVATGILLKKYEEPLNFTVASDILSFMDKFYGDYTTLLNIKLGILDNYDNMTIPKDTKETKEGYVVLHAKERKKILKIKFGRLIRKLIAAYNEKIGKPNNCIKVLNDDIIEKIHNSWVSHNTEVTSELVTGKDILKGYNSENYSKKGNLHSCMTNAFGRLELYTRNPNQIHLMIFNYQGEVCGRCLVWKCTDGKLYHDRIYTSFDWVLNSINEILKKEGIKNAKSGIKLTVKLDNLANVANHPYLDTFVSKNSAASTLSNY